LYIALLQVLQTDDSVAKSTSALRIAKKGIGKR